MSAPKLRPYVVYGTNIKDAEGQKIGHGGIAMLDLDLARTYNASHMLRPYIPESDNEPEPTHSVPSATKPKVRTSPGKSGN